MNDILEVLKKYSNSYLVNDDGKKFFYGEVLQLAEKYTKILSKNVKFCKNNLNFYKNAILIKNASPVQTIAIILACFETNGVAILIPKCLGNEEMTIAAEYPHNYTLSGQELERENSSDCGRVQYPFDANLILFTSGTNGKIRGVMLSKQNLITNVEAGVKHFPVVPQSSIVNILPLSHAYGLNIATLALLYSGCNIYFANNFTYQKLIKQIEPSYFFITPELIRMHQRIHQVLGFDAAWGKNAKYVFCGGDFVDESIRKYLEKCNIELFCSYGLTEAAPSVSAETFNVKKQGSVGKPIENVKVEIINNEIVIDGPNIALGYFDEWTRNGKTNVSALHTGDLGYIDSEGFLFVTGRIKNLIVFSDGKKFTAEHLEQSVKELLGEIQIRIYKNDVGELVAEYCGEFTEEDIRNSLSKVISPHHHEFKIKKKTAPMELTYSGKIKRG